MTLKSAPLRKVLSLLAGAAAIAVIFAAAALLGALVANATSPAQPRDGRYAFEGVSYKAECWETTTGADDFGAAFARTVNVCD